MFFAFAFLFTASVPCEGGEKRTTAKNKSRKFLFEKNPIKHYKKMGYSWPLQKTRTKNNVLKDCITDEHCCLSHRATEAQRPQRNNQ